MSNLFLGKRLFNLLIVLILIEGLFLAIAPDSVFACSCEEPGSPTEELGISTAVFAGKVVDTAAPTGAVISSADPVKVTFQVSEVWKGPVQNTLVVTTAREDASCGYKFYIGWEYLVYARGSENNLTTGLCSRTRPLSAATEDLTALKAGTVPTAELSFLLPVALLLGGAGIAIIIVVMIVIRKRSGQPFP